MPRFTIVTDEESHVPVEINARSASSALHRLHHLSWHEADVFQDGQYLFSARCNAGVWTVFQRSKHSQRRPLGQETMDKQTVPNVIAGD
jgi:hypothetical protein